MTSIAASRNSLPSASNSVRPSRTSETAAVSMLALQDSCAAELDANATTVNAIARRQGTGIMTKRELPEFGALAGWAAL
ncbi:MAG TPA: hypothetical protein VKP52_16555 [Pseudolabrys sp.]|nr:hypothetical protein [Pseudolabrys sp.]